VSASAEHPPAADTPDPSAPEAALPSPAEPAAPGEPARPWRFLPLWLARWFAARKARAAVRAELSPTLLICSLMMAASFIMVVWNLQDSSLDNANTGSRYATIESLADYGTFWIDQSRYVHTIDKYQVDGHYISSKPPVLPTLAAGVYWVYERLTGHTIRRYEGEVVRLISLCTGGLCHLIFLIYFYRLCCLLLKRQQAIWITMAAASFAYLGVAYATAINNHSTAAALAICGLYYACALRHGQLQKWWHWPITGFVLGLLPAVDLPGIAISGLIVLYLLAHDWKKTLFWLVPAMLPWGLLHLWLTYKISGSLMPFYTNRELHRFAGFHFRNATDIDGLRESKDIYAFNVLLGHHGVFSMTPLYLFGLWELLRSLRYRRFLRESILCAIALAGFFGFYILRTRNYGGWCVGMRWLVPVMPLLLLYFGIWVDRVKLTRLLWALVLSAFLVSCFNVQDGLTSPFQFSVWHNWLENAPNRNRVGKIFNVRGMKKRR
jgi:hypothetical protein